MKNIQIKVSSFLISVLAGVVLSISGPSPDSADASFKDCVCDSSGLMSRCESRNGKSTCEPYRQFSSKDHCEEAYKSNPSRCF